MYFVSLLTFGLWFGFVLPRILLSSRSRKTKGDTCFIFEASRPGWWVAKVTGWIVGLKVEMFRYQIVDIHLPDGELARLTVQYQDLAEVQRAVMKRWLPNPQSGIWSRSPYLEMFIRKAVGAELYRPLTMSRVAVWKAQSAGAKEPVIFFSLELGAEEVTRFGETLGAKGFVTTARWLNANIRRFLWRTCKGTLKRALELVRRGFATLRRLRLGNYSVSGYQKTVARYNILGGPSTKETKLGVVYVGRFNLEDPGKYSDLFFWQCSHLHAEDIILMFDYPQDPLDDEKLTELEKHGLEAVVLNSRATSTPRARVLPLPFRWHSPTATVGRKLETCCSRTERRWLAQQELSYHKMVQYRLDLFKATKVRVFASYHRWDGNHATMAEALKQLGGIFTLYQRSFDSNPALELAVITDVFFGWSRFGAEIERQSGSVIQYYVITGYVGGHRKPYLVSRANELRRRLMAAGARKILSFFDENSTDDPRWDPGHEFFRVDYEFLLEQILNDPSVGVIFKPKNSMTMRKRLGPIGNILELAEKTGRCIVLGSGAIQNTTTPLEAGLASDVTVGALYSGTPSLECALGGVPSLLFDREGFPRSPLYSLGFGRVVFQDWDALWHACEEHWRSAGGVPGFGDWSPMLDQLDPFRDGRAAERMGDYLKWLVEGLRAGVDRESVMAEAAERYCAQWGRDKVIEINGQLQSILSSASHGRKPFPEHAKEKPNSGNRRPADSPDQNIDG